MLLPLLQNNLLGAAPPPPVIQETVPYLIGMTQSHAEAVIAALHCLASVTGSTGTVTIQDPEAFTLIERGETISITLGGPINNGSSRRRGRGLPIYGNPYH